MKKNIPLNKSAIKLTNRKTISLSAIEKLKLKNLKKNKSTCWMCDGVKP